MLQITNVTYRVGGRPILENATAALGLGERVGLVGRNGTGKTTLLRLISGELSLDGGDISVPRSWRVGRVRQDAPSGATPLLEIVLAADLERAALLAEAQTCQDGLRQVEIHDRLNEIRADAAPARAARILAGLGLTPAQQARGADELSGGWRMRVALAALLFAEPDLLLLDEPTNHLDLEATLWLENYLKNYPGTLLLVSHDRDILNAVPQRILHLENNKLTLYGGNYDTFERTRREHLARQGAMAARQMAERKRIQDFIDRFKAKASKARQAQSRVKMLARMEPIASVIEQDTVAFTFPTPEELLPPLINLHEAVAGYDPAKPILRRLNLRLDPSDRIALLGANGNGKSTFMKLLVGELKPLSGELVKSSKLRVGYFAQDQAEVLDLEATPLLALRRLRPKVEETKLRGHLARFGLDSERVNTKVGSLSGGEKARLLFSLITVDEPQILLLDEPTNHLDIDARQALIQALNEYPGAVVLVSHDPHLVELVADDLWLVNEGTVKPYDGDLADYRSLLLGQAREKREPAAPKPKAEVPKQVAVSRQQQADLKKVAREAELRLAKLEGARRIIESRLADSSIYQGPPAIVQDLQSKLRELERAIAATEDSWLAAQSALEQA